MLSRVSWPAGLQLDGEICCNCFQIRTDLPTVRICSQILFRTGTSCSEGLRLDGKSCFHLFKVRDEPLTLRSCSQIPLSRVTLCPDGHPLDKGSCFNWFKVRGEPVNRLIRTITICMVSTSCYAELLHALLTVSSSTAGWSCFR